MPNCSKLKQHISTINAKMLKAYTTHKHTQQRAWQNKRCVTWWGYCCHVKGRTWQNKKCVLLPSGKTQGTTKQKMHTWWGYCYHQVKRRAQQNKRCVTWWGYCCRQVKHRAWQNNRCYLVGLLLPPDKTQGTTEQLSGDIQLCTA